MVSTMRKKSLFAQRLPHLFKCFSSCHRACIYLTRMINRVLHFVPFRLFYVSRTHLVPDGKPTVMSAHNSSSTSIYLNWKPPPKSSIHGEFLGYRLAYKQLEDTGSDSVQEIFLRDPSIEVCTLQISFNMNF